MVLVLTLLRELAIRSTNPSAILRQANDRICDRFRGNEPNLISTASSPSILAAVSCVTPAPGTSHCCSGSMRSGEVVPLHPTGMVLGAAASQSYPSLTLPYAAGDRLICYTDGISEARSPDGIEFGTERLSDTIRRISAGSLEQLGNGILEAVPSSSSTSDRTTTSVCALLNSTEHASGRPGKRGLQPAGHGRP